MAISPRKLRYDLYQNDSNTPLVISVLASLIERTMTRNERVMKNCKKTPLKVVKSRVFDCAETPDLSIQSYLERIFRYTKTRPPVYVVAYVYIDRFCKGHPEFRISTRNVHRLLITTIMVASKYVEDMNYRNSYFAKVGGLTTTEMNIGKSVLEEGYQIERALRCAEELKLRQNQERRYDQIAHVLL